MQRSIILSIVFFILLDFQAYTQLPKKAITKNDSISVDDGYVVFNEDTLFVITERLGPFSALDRAKAVNNRLADIASNVLLVEDSFNIVQFENSDLIFYKDIVILSVTDNDAKKNNELRNSISHRYKEIIRTTYLNQIETNSIKNWAIHIGLTLLAFVGLIVILYLIIRLFRWINNKLDEYEKKIKRKRKSVLRYLMPKSHRSVFILLSNIVKYILIIIILFLYLPLMFSFLPWTKGIVHEFYSYITEPVTFILNGILNFLPDLFYIIIIYFVARYIVRVLSYVVQEYEKDNIKLTGFHKDWAKPTLNIIKIIIYAFALIFIFPHLPGSNSPAFQGISIFFGVLLSLGSTSAIANIVAGIVITYMRPFQIGDRVRVNDTVGDVIEKSLLVTKIRTLKNEDVTIPNATIINTHLWNFSKNAKELGLILYTSVTIGYDVEWETVNKLLLRAARYTKLLQKDPKPFVLQKSLDDNYVSYELNVYTKQAGKMALIYSDLHVNILKAFNDAGIEILSPQYIATRDGSASTVPDLRNPVEKVIDKAKGKD